MNAARDPLSEIEARLANGDYYVTDLEFTPVFEDFRTLINEVKERDKTNALLRDLMAGQRESIDEYLTRIAELEAEVRELREEREQLAPLIEETHDALPALKEKLARAEQMEEALREIAGAEGLDPQHRAAELRAIARKALG